MNKAYYDPKEPGSLGGVDRLQRATKKPNKDVKRFLQGQRTYQLHKPRRVKFKRRKYMVAGIDDLWQADLADVTRLKEDNDGIAFLLIVIDVFSKMVWVRPLKTKTAGDTLAGIEDILESTERKPNNMMTDKCSEFVNQEAKNFYEKAHINFYTANNAETKAAIAERVIRTLKSRIYRYLTKQNTKRYINALQDIVSSYNNTKHRTIGMKPVEVTKKTETAVRQRAFLPTIFSPQPKFKFKVGDDVRLSILPSRFAKGYVPQWTEEIFQIATRQRTIPPTYKLRDKDGEKITGSFYEPELQKVPVYTELRSDTPSPEVGDTLPESEERPDSPEL